MGQIDYCCKMVMLVWKPVTLRRQTTAPYQFADDCVRSCRNSWHSGMVAWFLVRPVLACCSTAVSATALKRLRASTVVPPLKQTGMACYQAAKKDFVVVLLSEIFPGKLQMFGEGIDAWIQVRCM